MAATEPGRHTARNMKEKERKARKLAEPRHGRELVQSGGFWTRTRIWPASSSQQGWQEGWQGWQRWQEGWREGSSEGWSSWESAWRQG